MLKGLASRSLVVVALVICASVASDHVSPTHSTVDAAACPDPLSGTPTSAVYLPNVTRTLGGATGWQTPFIVQNSGTQPTDIEVTFYAFADGSCVTRRVIRSMAPGTSYADVPNNDTDLPDDSQFSVVVRSFGSVIVSVVNEHAGVGARAEAMSYDGFNSGATKAFLPNIVRRFFGYDSPFIIQNLGTNTDVVTASFVSFDGTSTLMTTRRIAPGRSQFIDPNFEAGLVDGKQYSVTVTSPEAIAVVVNTQQDGPSIANPVAYSTDGLSIGASNVYGPYATKRQIGFLSTIVVENVGTTTVTPSLAFTPLVGTTGSQSQTFTSPSAIAPGAAWAFDPRFALGTTTPCSGASATCLGDGDYSFVASATGGSIAVAVNLIDPSRAMGYTGLPVAAGRVFLPNITRTLGGATGWTTPIYLQSVTATSATLRWFRFSDGQLALLQTVPLTAGAAVLIDPRSVNGLNDDTQYAVVAETSAGTIVAIVTELSSAGGDGAMGYEGFPDLTTVPAPTPSPSPTPTPSPTPAPSPTPMPTPTPSPTPTPTATP